MKTELELRQEFTESPERWADAQQVAQDMIAKAITEIATHGVEADEFEHFLYAYSMLIQEFKNRMFEISFDRKQN